MLNEIILAIIQAATEFLPISSSGHLALFQNLISKPNLFLITILHLASLLAVLIFLRKEIFNLLSFKEKYRRLWLFLIIGTIPAALFGVLFKDFIEKTLSSFLFMGIFFLFTSAIIFLTKFARNGRKLNIKNSLFIGLIQILALFPGVSRSGMTISSALFSGIKREEAFKFSFLLFIPLAIGANILEIGNSYFSLSLLVSFIVCFVLSYLFLGILFTILKKKKFWLFSLYTLIMGLISLTLYFI